MNIKYLILILLLSFVTNRSEVTDTKIVNIKDVQFPITNLESKVVGGWINDQVELPRSIAVKGDHLLVIENDFRINEQLIKFFSLSEKKMTGYYGRSGRGPGEILGGIQIVPVFGEAERFSFLDFSRKRVSKIDISEVLNGEHYKEPELYKILPPAYIKMQTAVILNDTLLVGSGAIREGKLVFANFKTDEYRLTDFIPKKGQNVNSYLKANIYLTRLAANANRKKVVASNLFFNQIEIYNYYGDLELIISGDSSNQVFDDSPDRWHTNSTVEYYTHVITTDKYIMAAYYNKSHDELYDEMGEIKEGIKTAIRVFDWSGNPVKQFNLDKYISQFTFDERENKFIAIAPNELKSVIEYSSEL